MKLENHVVKKLLIDPVGFAAEVIEAMSDTGMGQLRNKEGEIDLDAYDDIIHMLSGSGNKTYYITNSVTEHLELFDTKKCMDANGWSVFKSLGDFKKTYILPDMHPSYAKYGGSSYLRVFKHGNMIQFFHNTCKFLPPEERTRHIDSQMYFVILYINLETNEMCHHFQSNDGKSLAPMLYALMCFVELCDNEIHIVPPKAKYGTQKTGKIINTTPFPITVINKNWNITTIRSKGFPVSGHIALFWTGPGRTVPKMLYVQPYMKNGYTRKAGKLTA